MRRVYGAIQAPQAHVIADLLAGSGIAVTLGGENSNLLSGVGLGVDIYLVDDADYDRARQILADFEARMIEDEDDGAGHQAPTTWRCAGCGETHEAVFDSCWRCGGDRG